MLSIILVDYNAKDYLERCIKSIKDVVNVSHEIIVVDNNKVNRGFAKAVNIGAKEAKGECLLLLNPDTEILEGDFKALTNFLKSNSTPRVGIVGLNLVLEDGNPQPHSYGTKLSFCDAVFSKLKAKSPRLWRGRQRLRAFPDWVSGGAMIVKKDLFDRLGGFDEQFFMYFEDQDLCLRAKKLEYKIMVWNRIKVVHYGGEPLGGKSQQESRKKQLLLYYDSQLKFIKKHYSRFYALLFRAIRFPYKLFKSQSFY